MIKICILLVSLLIFLRNRKYFKISDFENQFGNNEIPFNTYNRN